MGHSRRKNGSLGIYVCSVLGEEDGSQKSGDCDDTTKVRTPGKSEICDGEDNNCDGSVDNGVPPSGLTCSVGTGECINTGILLCDNGTYSKTLLACGGPLVSDEFDAFGVYGFPGWEEISPDARGCGEIGQGSAECLDDEPVVVSARTDGLECGGPVAGASG